MVEASRAGADNCFFVAPRADGSNAGQQEGSDAGASDIKEMLVEIDRVWRDPATSDVLSERLWSVQGGYGIPGFMPVQGYDWSGIRDSSDESINARYAAIREELAGD